MLKWIVQRATKVIDLETSLTILSNFEQIDLNDNYVYWLFILEKSFYSEIIESSKTRFGCQNIFYFAHVFSCITNTFVDLTFSGSVEVVEVRIAMSQLRSDVFLRNAKRIK